MISSYKCILFDVDGVILSSIDHFSKTFREIAEKLGASKAFHNSFYRKNIGINIASWMLPIIPESNRHKLKALFISKTEQVDNPQNIPLIDGTIFTLTKIKDSGKKTGLISTKPRNAMNAYLTFYKLNNLIDYSVAGDEVNHFKPDPEGINKALSYFDSDPIETVFIGDSLHDFGAAKNAKTSFIGVLSGIADKSDWENAKVPYIPSIKYL